ncbi:ABC transporter ATP-binding protein [Chryseobacterium sediminis]|uniref:ATP-binding cassette domain-containing protein n=1 Tax=Chryseobacterium sediminis TaxID=1679494 RepID=A0A5B2U3X9_9FLAO|nr:polysaccharide ABC transporter ATP-binding protein [Chryseobacterium sediminis]KAA2221197.1 ATP-binding cassette domain-containing protein [Chryseobacterium sediminis]MBB6332248.1 lipopolysaccharide transport system ATP-binding protein [Chryseobacterium sediminis]
MLALKAENISKQYRLGQVGTGTLSHDLNRFWHKVRGKEDPYLKIGETNDRTTKGDSEYVWSLRDINFEIEKGDAVGIIGRNGAGKSTLLKLLSKVTKPTTGKIYTNGRIASLLEVGTGFHPEMTGRENVFLNGAILGMTRKEIKRKFDEIVAFSGVERYIDTPVKRYSSGMYVRLAFAVAAHLESEILIVDEVLAVGDAEFQKKCLGKMNDVTKGEGRTILFVSHNMAAVKQLCTSGILMKNGKLAHQGDINDVLENYIINELSPNIEFRYIEDISKKAQIQKVRAYNNKSVETTEFGHNEDINLDISFINRSVNTGIRVNIAVLDKFENVIFITRKVFDGKNENNFTIKIEGGKLIPNTYVLSVAIDTPSVELYDIIKGGVQLNIIETGHENFLAGDTDNGIITPPVIWM